MVYQCASWLKPVMECSGIAHADKQATVTVAAAVVSAAAADAQSHLELYLTCNVNQHMT